MFAPQALRQQDEPKKILACGAPTPIWFFYSDPETGTPPISFTENVTGMEGLVEDGLVEHVEMLDGEVSITLDFDDSNRVDVFIEQIERLSE